MAQFAGALEEGADGPVALKEEVAAVFNLRACIDAVQAGAGGPFRGENFGPRISAQ